MATTKLWHIKGRLKDLLVYVENPEKTMVEKPDLQPLWDVLSYVQRPAATEQGEYVTAVNCLKETALQQMIQTKKRFGLSWARHSVVWLRKADNQNTDLSSSARQINEKMKL